MIPQDSINLSTVTAFTFFFVLYLLPSVGNSMALNDEGSFTDCRYECNLAHVTLKKKMSNRTYYRITTKCNWKVYGPSACPPESPKTFIGEGWWDTVLKMAYENIQFTNPYRIETLAKCTSNPWLGSWVECTKIQRDVVVDNFQSLPEYTPVSAKLMSYDNKQLLQQQEDMASEYAQAPYFLHPVNNAEFIRPTPISVKVRHLAQYGVELDLERYDSGSFNDYSPGGLPFPYLTSPEGSSTYNIITKTKFKSIPGSYRVRARCKTTDAEWSDYVHFTVLQTPAPQFVEPKENQKFTPSENVPVRVIHQPECEVTFRFEWTPITKPGEWPDNSIKIEASSSSTTWEGHGNGEKSAFYNFKKPGYYQVYAHYTTGNCTKSSSTRTFGIIPQSMGLEQVSPSQISLKQKISPVGSPEKKSITITQTHKRFTTSSPVRFSLGNTLRRNLVFDFQYKEGTRPFRPVSISTVVRLRHDKGNSIVTIDNLQAGKWRVRVRHSKMKSEWTNWHNFVVVDLKRKTQLKKPLLKNSFSTGTMKSAILLKVPEIIAPKKHSTAKARSKVSFLIKHSKKCKLSFSFQYRHKPGSGSYKSCVVNVRGLKSGNGQTKGFLTFKNSGEYRFRVKGKQQNAKWGKWRDFTIKSDMQMIKKKTPKHRTPQNNRQQAEEQDRPNTIQRTPAPFSLRE